MERDLAAGDFRVELFSHDDDGYLDWLREHAAGFVLNAPRSLNPSSVVLHRADCRTINGTPTRGGPWTGPYVKVCADDPIEVAAWAGANVGTTPRRCGTCHPRAVSA